ncbi:AAA family ATPase [Sinorhizobium meliloti]|uniref:AAA family ATPase n=1 Tax=Rhizobium meliloti TaxID=382 RepID=UPI000B49BD9D|nr:AAA family ATPase [Sinorhizobium meliloti]ASQ12711.1 plasmid partitioning protein RepA [Sinorhizobium meliloti]MDW9372354.1 AAA family ATPase [Sinorhizobium meliloti]MDW9401145.1 AAA family ATPase [Sinorhizobium meliloti]MDW9540617.1 AAA family ATPase [Sinorhizobium meliloti]MDW9551377.1 AAA family ATPase [Sinorhizobium meliloti]
MPQPVSPPHEKETTSERIGRYRKEIQDRLIERVAAPKYPIAFPSTLRSFSLGEVAEILGVSGSYLRQLSIDGLGPTPETGTAGRRSYTLPQINELRAHLASTRPKEALKFCPRRRDGEKLQIISVAVGSASTTTSFYLAQGLALQGFRVLAIDLDERGSLSKMFGYLRTGFPVHNASMSAVLRYDDDDRVSMGSVILPTKFDGLNFVPGTFELGDFEDESSRRCYSSKWGYPDAGIRMVNALKEVEEKYDVVVIHCGHGSFLTAAAYEAATGVLMTVRPELPEILSMTLSLGHFQHFVSLMEQAGRPVAHDFIKFLVTRHDPRDLSQQEAVAGLRDSLGNDLLTATVWESGAILQAWTKNLSLYELSAGDVGRSAYEQAMETLSSTNAEVMDLMCQVWGRPPIYVSQASRTTIAGKAKSPSRMA